MNETNEDFLDLANKFRDYYNTIHQKAKQEEKSKMEVISGINKYQTQEARIEELAKVLSHTITKEKAISASWVTYPDKTYDFGLGAIDFNKEKREAFIKGYEKAIQDLKSNSAGTNITPIIMECDITINEDENY